MSRRSRNWSGSRIRLHQAILVDIRRMLHLVGLYQPEDDILEEPEQE
jgi:hypothetical protein